MKIPHRRLFGALAGTAVAGTAAFAEAEPQTRKEVYCEACGSNQPMIEHEPQKDDLNPYPWYDITCGTCYTIIASVQIVPDNKPVEPSTAVTSEPQPEREPHRIVSEVVFNRMAEALQRAQHALVCSSGLIAHDGKPEYAFNLDNTKEIRFIDETLKLADVKPRPLDPLT
jgi:hypothetical protein